ncbi:MAG: hypothetical protein MJB14_22290, partial [Spirochaetes bacterium]|nr:hypothetical protein [Spirochaetota bacterium]
MQSKKTKTNNKQTTENKKKTLSTKTLKIILSITITVFFFSVLGLTIVLIWQNYLPSLRKNNDNQTILKLADEHYQAGYLENSAIAYQNYLNTNPSDRKKIQAYQKLFEISVLNNKIDDAFVYLKEINLIDPTRSDVYLNRLKLFLREDMLASVEGELKQMEAKYKKSNEFQEIYGIYLMKQSNFSEALKTFLNIPFRKREISVHQKIMQCYLKLEKWKEADSYLTKIEKKTKQLDNTDFKAELVLYDYLIQILSGRFVKSVQPENVVMVHTLQEKEISSKILAYSYLITNDTKSLEKLLLQLESIQDPQFLQSIADYYYFQ